MYRIKNITNSKVVIGDLQGIIIKKDEEVDLDSMFSRNIIEASRDLEKAISTSPKRQCLVVLYKDTYPLMQQVVEVPQVSPGAIEEMVQKSIDKLLPKNNDLHNKLDIIIAALGNQQARSANEPTPVKKEDSSNDTSVDIQTRLLKRLSNNVESRVEIKEKVKDSSDLTKNADELSELLDQM